jgi:hypothetical protein
VAVYAGFAAAINPVQVYSTVMYGTHTTLFCETYRGILAKSQKTLDSLVNKFFNELFWFCYDTLSAKLILKYGILIIHILFKYQKGGKGEVK